MLASGVNLDKELNFIHAMELIIIHTQISTENMHAEHSSQSLVQSKHLVVLLMPAIEDAEAQRG